MANKNVFQGAIESVRKRFYDDFTRADSAGTLGPAKDGSLWKVVRGSFGITSNKAVGVDANYPMVTQVMPTQDAVISIGSASQGSSASLWVTGSGDWWAVGIDQATVACNCQTCHDCTAYNAVTCNTYNVANCNAYYYVCNAYTASTCNAYTSGNCNAYTAGNCITWVNGTCTTYTTVCNGYNTSNCKGYNTAVCNGYTGNTKNFANCLGYTQNCNGWNASNCGGTTSNCNQSNAGYCSSANAAVCNSANAAVCNSSNAATCNSSTNNCNAYTASTCNSYNTSNCLTYNTYACNCQTCYPQSIRIMKSVGSVISEVTNWTISAVAQSFKVLTTGNQITVKAYSDNSFATQIDSDLVYSPTGAALTSEYGLTVKPSSYSQGYATGSVTIERN
jgi:hypothetical protein